MSGLALAALRALEGVSAIEGDERVHVDGVFSDSRQVEPGSMFAVIAGASADGARFVDDAIARGAVAVLSHKRPTTRVPCVLVDDVRKWLGPIAHAVYGEPTRSVRAIGVTGTNGKTTVSYLVEEMLSQAGLVPAMMGTVELRGPTGRRPAELTTPEADVVARFIAREKAHGATHLVMEVSSHALEQGRASGIRFEVCAFTNLTQDHLDFHKTMEAYGTAKARLFVEYNPKHSVICVDAPFGKELARRARGRLTRVATEPNAEAEIQVSQFTSSRTGIVAQVKTRAGDFTLQSPLFGAHNLENLVVSVGIGQALGLSIEQMTRALSAAKGAPGRMERVETERDLLVLVDYAHTPDALERALAALRPLTAGRLFAVAGCGGDRDAQKRAPMGQAVVAGADIAILTSDNPRTEDPEAILRDMEAGLSAAGVTRVAAGELSMCRRGYTVIADRREAIFAAIRSARPGDTVLLAGKGHEPYQILGQTKYPFDDRHEANEALAELGGG